MSLIDRFLPRTLCIVLEPGQLTAVLRKGAVFVGESAYRQRFVNEDDHWQAPLTALAAYLQQAGDAIKEVPVSYVLSSKWCRMMMVPWSDALLEPVAAKHFLQLQYTALHGDAARDWAITTDDAPYGQPRLACAIDNSLLEAIKKVSLDNRHTCRALEPAASLALRAVGTNASAGPRAFAVVESGRLTLLATARGRINAVHAQGVGDNWAPELIRAWQRWTLREPGLADLKEVAVIDLTGNADTQALPDLFRQVSVPLNGLPSYSSFAACGLGA